MAGYAPTFQLETKRGQESRVTTSSLIHFGALWSPPEDTRCVCRVVCVVILTCLRSPEH